MRRAHHWQPLTIRSKSASGISRKSSAKRKSSNVNRSPPRPRRTRANRSQPAPTRSLRDIPAVIDPACLADCRASFQSVRMPTSRTDCRLHSGKQAVARLAFSQRHDTLPFRRAIPMWGNAHTGARKDAIFHWRSGKMRQPPESPTCVSMHFKLRNLHSP